MILPGLVFRPQLMAFGNLLYIVILCIPPHYRRPLREVSGNTLNSLLTIVNLEGK